LSRFFLVHLLDRCPVLFFGDSMIRIARGREDDLPSRLRLGLPGKVVGQSFFDDLCERPMSLGSEFLGPPRELGVHPDRSPHACMIGF